MYANMILGQFAHGEFRTPKFALKDTIILALRNT